MLGARADEHVAGPAGVSGLDAVDPRHPSYEGVAVADHAHVVAGDEDRSRSRHHAAEEAVVGQQVARQLDQVVRARVVARRVQPTRRRVVGVVQTELPGARVHHADEAPDRAVSDVEGQVFGRVVGARQHQRQQQVVDAHALAWYEADLRVDGRRIEVVLGEQLTQARVLEREQRGHQLGRAGDRVARVGRDAVELLARALLDQRGGGDTESRWRAGCRGVRESEQRDGDSGGERRGSGRYPGPGAVEGDGAWAFMPTHRRSLSRWAVCRALGSTLRFSASSVVTEIPVFLAMLVRLSPGCTM